MGRIYHSVTELIGNTPLMEMCAVERKYGLQARILAKLEYLNPVGSVKERPAMSILDRAEAAGIIHPGMALILPSQGDMAISMAALAAARGYRFLVVVPERCSPERRRLFQYLGAELVLTETLRGMRGSIAKAKELAQTMPDSYLIDPFEDPANSLAHKLSTGLEIWNDTTGKVDVFVAGIGSGGTITGVGEYLKMLNPAIRVVAVEPAASPLLSQGKLGAAKIKGIGASFIPKILNTSVYDEIIPVTDEAAYQTTREIARTEGILAGVSSGAALWACIQLAKRGEYRDKNIVTIFSDSAERYIETDLFDEW